MTAESPVREIEKGNNMNFIDRRVERLSSEYNSRTIPRCEYVYHPQHFEYLGGSVPSDVQQQSRKVVLKTTTKWTMHDERQFIVKCHIKKDPQFPPLVAGYLPSPIEYYV
ncbi:hypothetical protein Clacol_000190 [Clathrus columnatus]|uniref:Uncharacterized protein n=1 Tax=Clathrus columnatus TaxID=1419009 RepID=A0AAV4ZY02_9AGAM|nr:hypothetical protein Clacol_000190 [Clathrus columnatus]